MSHQEGNDDICKGGRCFVDVGKNITILQWNTTSVGVSVYVQIYTQSRIRYSQPPDTWLHALSTFCRPFLQKTANICRNGSCLPAYALCFDTVRRKIGQFLYERYNLEQIGSWCRWHATPVRGCSSEGRAGVIGISCLFAFWKVLKKVYYFLFYGLFRYYGWFIFFSLT